MEGTSEKETVLAAYADGVEAVGRLGAAVTDWSGPTPCADWRAVDLAGHLVAVVTYFGRLLDASQQGSPLTELPLGSALAAMNARDLAALSDVGRLGAEGPSVVGPERIARFLRAARRHTERLADADWNAVLGWWDGAGALTIGQHTGLAVGEWHVHAWDLARGTATIEHRPADPDTVAAGRVALFGRPPAEEESQNEEEPWLVVLRSAGRTPPAT